MSALINLADNSAVYDVAKVSALSIASQLSKRFQNQIYLKREDDQVIHSFKLRGAYQKMSSMSEEQKSKGVIASSAGNHAQGVALGASSFISRQSLSCQQALQKLRFKRLSSSEPRLFCMATFMMMLFIMLKS